MAFSAALWLLPAAVPVSAIAQTAPKPGEVLFESVVYTAEEFETGVLNPLHAKGGSLQILLMPDQSLQAVRTESQLSNLMQEIYGEAPPADFFNEDPQGSTEGPVPGKSCGNSSMLTAGRMAATSNCPNIHNMTVRIWVHDNCGGAYLSSFGNDDVPDLERYGHDDTTSSIQVGGVMDYFRGYWYKNYLGSVLNIYGNGNGTDKNWGAPALGSWNDKISSYITRCSSC